ncbi:uncharacterized protein LOC143277796 [Babylonia areolata]|uniref:uncharacterized protein LOC143277796 n=1 Tax=Babylonia areolata TaxID=304850 RepID=UPI003FD23161
MAATSTAELRHPFDCVCSFCSLIEAGRLEEVRKLIQAEQDRCRCWAKQVVYRVVRYYRRFLREQRGDSVAKAAVWRTPAVYRSQTRALVLEVCAKLLAGGAPINYTTGVETPLMAALSTCDEELLWLLLGFKADVNLCDGVEDMNALGLAILLNQVPLVEILLKHGAKVNSLCCGNLAPIQLAMNKSSAVSDLLIQHGADAHQLRGLSLDDRLLAGQSPLLVAVLRRNLHLGRLLLEHGEDVNQTFNDTLESPIHQAVRGLDPDMVELLIEHGADLNRPNFEGHTPLGLALVGPAAPAGVDSSAADVATAIAKRLVRAGASATRRTRISYFQKAYSPLHIASFKGNLEFVRFLVEEVCPRVGFDGEEVEGEAAPPASEAGGKKGEKKEGSVWVSPKGPQESYFKLLRRNERFWASTPSSSSSSSTPSTHPSLAPPSFPADSEDYHVRSEVSSTPTTNITSSSSSPSSLKTDTAAARDLTGRKESGVDQDLSNPASPPVSDIPVSPLSSADTVGVTTDLAATAAAREGSICSVCRDRKDKVDASGSSPTQIPATAEKDKPAEDSEPQNNIVFVIGGEKIEKPTVKDQWIVSDQEDDDARCNCCEFCLSPDVLSSVLFVVNRGTQTDSSYDTGDAKEGSADYDSSLSTSSPPGSTSAASDSQSNNVLKSGPSQMNSRSLEEEEPQDCSSQATPSDPASPQLRHSSTQTHIRMQLLNTQTPSQGAMAVMAAEAEAGAVAVETGTTMSRESPVFQAEFGSPDYIYPSGEDAARWQEQFAGCRQQKKEEEAAARGGGGQQGGRSYSVARFLNQVGSDGSTALFMAVYDGNVELVDYLLGHGADPHFSSQHGNFFHAAVLSQSLPLLHRALGLGCRINEVNMFGNSPLTLVSRLDLPDACDLLVSRGADMNSRDRYGETPLLASVYFGCEMNARTLIQHGAALDLVDDNHTSAIYWSIFNNRQRTLKLLLMAGASFTPQVFRQYPRNIRVMNNRPLFQFIQHYVHQPRSLRDLATIRTRIHMGRVKQGRSILSDLDLLPIPNRLKDILRLKHFIQQIDAEAEAAELLEK